MLYYSLFQLFFTICNYLLNIAPKHTKGYAKGMQKPYFKYENYLTGGQKVAGSNLCKCSDF